MSNPPGFDWYTSDIWPNTHNRTAGAFQNVPDPINNPSDFAFASIDPLLLDHAATLPPELLNPGYTGPAADSGSYLGSLDWLADETTFGQTSSGRYGTAGLRPRNLDHHPSLHIPPIGPNNGPSSQVPHTPMAGPSGSSRGRTVSPRERRRYLFTILFIGCINSDLSTVMWQPTPVPLNANGRAARILVSFLEESNWSDTSRQSIFSQGPTNVRSQAARSYSIGEIIYGNIRIGYIELCICFILFPRALFSRAFCERGIYSSLIVLFSKVLVTQTCFNDALRFPLLLYSLVDINVCQIRKERRTTNQNVVIKNELGPSASSQWEDNILLVLSRSMHGRSLAV